MSSRDLSRVRYTPRQFLGATDFSDEQGHHVGMRRRHNIAHHTWGIVHGLELVVEEEDDLFVQPGFAVDGFGRELVLEQRLGVAITEFDDQGADALDVFLSWAQREESAEREEPLWDRVAKNRWRESVAVETRRADPDVDFRIDPPDRAPSDADFTAHSPQHDDPTRRWMIYLGRFERKRRPDRTYEYKAVLDNRPYAGLVAEAIVTPWEGGPRIDLGADSTKLRDQAIDPLFAVSFAKPGDQDGRDLPIFEVRKGGVTKVRGKTTVVGSIRVAGGGVRFETTGAAPTPNEWGIFRTSAKEAFGNETKDFADLRIVAGSSAIGAQRVVIGAWDADNGWHPCLTVESDGTVTVHGDLVVEGDVSPRLVVSQVKSAEYEALLQNALIAGLGAGGAPSATLLERIVATQKAQLNSLAVATKSDQSFWEKFRAFVQDLFEPD